MNDEWFGVLGAALLGAALIVFSRPIGEVLARVFSWDKARSNEESNRVQFVVIGALLVLVAAIVVAC